MPISLSSEDVRHHLAASLELGEVVSYTVCPFPLPAEEELTFLREQELSSRVHKNISYKPARRRVGGVGRIPQAQRERLQKILGNFSASVTEWVYETLPMYRSGCRLDQVSYRPLEEATRSLRLKARNDLLHVDAFPTRPTNGWRILRVFVNINPTEPRVWVTSEPFARLLERHGHAAGLPGTGRGWLRAFPRLVLDAVHGRSEYDSFMLRFHDYLKANEQFQERTLKRLWHFLPGSAWMVMTDACSHAVLRGRYALEHSYFINPQSLVCPEESPHALLEKICGRPVLRRAA